MINELKRLRKWAFSIYIPMTLSMIYFNGIYTPIGATIYPFYIIVGIVTIINIITILEERGKQLTNYKLSETTFFIYAFHGFIGLRIAGLILNLLFPITNNYWPYITIHYLLKPILTIGICLIAFYLMKKYIPSTMNMLTGNRN
ncbi:hypothetical protein [Bacteroides ilei]|uniref:hypothetical protein n=1 Tax=Bacteroides ilei TaxID=1907658 RepID=UPI00092FF372|nr:hypothetical protein [Bacteroides ilei]